MIRFGAHAFVWIGDWTAEAGDRAIREAAEAGFDFLEIPLLNPEGFDAARHRRALSAAGVGATCSLVCRGTPISRPPPSARAASCVLRSTAPRRWAPRCCVAVSVTRWAC